jgi:predicted O-methyltransferase YrrM
MITTLRNGIKRVPWLKALVLPVVNEASNIQFAWRKVSTPIGIDPPLNGQKRRRECISAIMAAVQPDEIVETGTYRGSTTEYFAKEYGLPVHTIENNKYFYLYSKLRLLRNRLAHVYFGDSPLLIHKRIAAGAGAKRMFFYLDAHWFDSPPLIEEVLLIVNNCTEAIICIDDFRVDGDPGYRFDTYGSISLSLDYLNLPPGVSVYFPADPAVSETGLKRGALFIAIGKTVQAKVATCSPRHLRPLLYG